MLQIKGEVVVQVRDMQVDDEKVCLMKGEKKELLNKRIDEDKTESLCLAKVYCRDLKNVFLKDITG